MIRMKKAAVITVVVHVLFAGLFTQCQTAVADKSAEQIIQRVRKKVNNLKTLSCSFDQEHFMKAADRTRTVSGTIRLKKPFNLRVDSPVQTIVVDGETVWWYIPKNRQVTLQTFEKEAEMFPTPHGLFRKYVADEESARNAVLEGAEDLNGSACYILRMAAGLEGAHTATVWIDRKLDFPVKSIEERENGDRTTYILRDVTLNKKLGDDIFTFEAPEGVSVVDMR